MRAAQTGMGTQEHDDVMQRGEELKHGLQTLAMMLYARQ